MKKGVLKSLLSTLQCLQNPSQNTKCYNCNSLVTWILSHAIHCAQDQEQRNMHMIEYYYDVLLICMSFLFKEHPQIRPSDVLLLCEGQCRMAFAGYAHLSPCWRSGSYRRARAHAQRRLLCDAPWQRRCAGVWRGTLGTRFNISRGKDAAHRSPSGEWVSIMLLCTTKLK